MSDAAASTQTFASGRYSKRKRTQVMYRLDDLDYSDTESDFESPRAKKPKARTTPRPPPKSKVFRFLDLPAEIRNKIYSYALCDPAGINFIGSFKHKRRSVARVPADHMDSAYGPRRYMSDASTVAECKALPTLLPSLLAVNKQIYAEGIDMLYGNEFIFFDSSALYAFLINIGPSAARHVKSIRLISWEYGRSKTAYNNVCFATLVWATNLTSLHIEALMCYFRPSESAEKLYRNAFPWLEAVAAAKGKRDAALDILQLSPKCFRNHWISSTPLDTYADKVAQFKAALAACLNKHHDRIMAPPGKLAKKARRKRTVDE